MKRPSSESTPAPSRPKLYQFRAAGPMLLRNPTQPELQHLRSVTSLPNPKIRHLVMSFLPNTRTPMLQVFAHAMEKQTAAAWRSILGHRMENIAPPAEKSVVHVIQMCRGLRFNEITRQYTAEVQAEEFGTPSRSLHLDPIPPPPARGSSSQCASPPPENQTSSNKTIPIQSLVANRAYAMTASDHAFLAQLDLLT